LHCLVFRIFSQNNRLRRCRINNVGDTGYLHLKKRAHIRLPDVLTDLL
jgi:hypothetical protein